MAGIYIHIPFCKKLCSYCDFYHVISGGDHSSFIEALVREMEMRRSYTGTEEISTLYIGGGTPSVLSLEETGVIFESLWRSFNISSDPEITIELNPDDVNPPYLSGLKTLKVNRISLGIQSWHDDDLRLLNRRHDSLQASAALDEIRNAGFENISADLIYGIPGMTTARWAENLDLTFSKDIKHLSAYHLSIEKGTPFRKMKEKGLLQETEEEESVAQFNLLTEKAEIAGFIQYEISNFAQPGYFSIHNTNYWKQVTYLGLGPSAHSFNGYSRQWNIRDLKGYIKAVGSGREFYEKEELDNRTRFNEYIMTSLRTMWGIDLEYVEKVFEKEGYDYLLNIAGKFIAYGLMKHQNNTLVLTNQGKMISDNLISELMIPGK
ncbi:MAG: radical SAM family heme chaperone HemW [Bacteroidales bacterium]|nr:radical SAM family heme chaperone HemW [Bacteroidales bacterium]